MNKFLVLIISTIIVITISCDSDSPVSSYDEQLKREIIGKWTDSEGYTVEFYEIGFFRDTIFTSTTIGTNVDTMIVVRYGKYTIYNSILTQTDFTFEYVYLVNISGIAISRGESKVIINNKNMQLQGLRSFVNENKSSQDLWGTWITKIYYCSYDTDSSNINGPSYGNETYAFLKDSSKFQKIVEYDYPISYIDTAWYDYSYNPPYLNIPGMAFYNLRVVFEYDKMIWYYDNALNNLVKIR